jgi:hypothetical protein
MGYSHYWTLENGIEASKWADFIKGAKEIIATAKDAGIFVADFSEGDTIHINGIGYGAHEDFVISTEDVGYDFCKTAQKPYDTVVTALLIQLKRSLGKDVVIKSDGNWNDWESGCLLFETVYGIQPELVFG